MCLFVVEFDVVIGRVIFSCWAAFAFCGLPCRVYDGINQCFDLISRGVALLRLLAMGVVVAVGLTLGVRSTVIVFQTGYF